MKDPNVQPSVSATSLTLMQRVQANDQDAWFTFKRLYGPLIYAWCRRRGLNAVDSDDVSQEVFKKVHRSLGAFRHNGRKGALRKWLKKITGNQIIDWERKKHPGDLAVGGETANRQLLEVPDPDGDPADESTSEELSEDRAILYRRAYELMQSEFNGEHIEIFRRRIENDEPAASVAADFGLTVGSVAVIVSRIKTRLRELFEDD